MLGPYTYNKDLNLKISLILLVGKEMIDSLLVFMSDCWTLVINYLVWDKNVKNFKDYIDTL